VHGIWSKREKERERETGREGEEKDSKRWRIVGKGGELARTRDKEDAEEEHVGKGFLSAD